MRKLLWVLALTMLGCGGEKTPPPPVPSELLVSESALQDQLRQLWLERVFYSRALMIGTLHGLADREVLSERLRKNRDDLATAFDTFYASVAASAQIATYLDADQNHLEAALDVASEGGDFGDMKEPWKDNIKELADYLESINSELPGSVDGELNDYVDHAFNQLKQRMAADWIDDVNAFDNSVKNANQLADGLTKGFLKQYPDHVTEETNEKFQELRTDQRTLWMDHFMWQHFFNVSGVHQLPDLSASKPRTLLNQSALGKSFKPLYGPTTGDHLSVLLMDHVLNIEQLVNYTRAGDQTSIVTTKVIGYANADQIAQLFSSANPNLPLELTRPRMKRYLDLVYEDIDSLFAGDAQRELGALEELEVLLIETADAISAATQAMFPNEVNE